jgi:hypothetical protein
LELETKRSYTGQDLESKGCVGVTIIFILSINLWTGLLVCRDTLSESTNPLHDVENRLSWLTNPLNRLGSVRGCITMINQPPVQTWCTVMINQPSGHTVLCRRINYHGYPNLWTELMVWEDTKFWLTNPLDRLGGVGGCATTINQQLPISLFSQGLSANTRAHPCNITNRWYGPQWQLCNAQYHCNWMNDHWSRTSYA